MFKTNVVANDEAERILRTIHHCFEGYRANFDLQDCDRILRVQSGNGPLQPEKIIGLLNGLGYEIDVLPG